MKCVHSIPGRIRFLIPALKHNVLMGERIEWSLGGLRGVDFVAANPLTGSALIRYDPTEITPSRLVQILQCYDLPQETPEQNSSIGNFLKTLLLVLLDDVILFLVFRLDG